MIGDNSYFKTSLLALTDLCMPRLCVCCGRRLLAREHYLCIYCEVELPLTYLWTAEQNPMADKFNELVQSQGRYIPYIYAAALFYYRSTNVYSRITQVLKYDGFLSCGRFFAKKLGMYLRSSDQFADVDVVVPVPLHWKRRRERGYNQAEVIAAEVALIIGAKMVGRLLIRGRSTLTQTELSVDKKIKNVSGAFMVSHKVAAKLCGSTIHHILIVDDVFTTGATLFECFKVLREAFPSDVRISIATLAFVQQ